MGGPRARRRGGGGELIRSDDLFFGGAEPDWVDLDKVAIPQADEQQRLLANLVTQMSADRMPLPRFWYLPRGEKAAVVMTGDDHANGGTTGQFNRFKAASPPGCSVADWQCVRATSYVFPGTSIPGAEGFEADGFEIALHLDTGCKNFTRESLAANWSDQLPAFRSAFPTLDAPATNRTHCIAWSDWASEPIVELANGVRLDTNYYYWPEALGERPAGDVHRLGHADALRRPRRLDDRRLPGGDAADRRVGHQHTPRTSRRCSTARSVPRATTASSRPTCTRTTPSTTAPTRSWPRRRQRGVPVISARQMLEWLDGRNDSSFGELAFSGNRLRFSVQRGGAGARGLEAMLPVAGPTGELSTVTRGGAEITTAARTVKGIEYAVFDAAAGDYDSDVRHGAGRSRAARHDDHRVLGERELGARRLHVQRVRRAVRVPDGRRPVRRRARARRSTPASPAVSTHFGCGRSIRRAPSIRRPPSARSPWRPPRAPGGQLPPPGGESGRPGATAPTPAGSPVLGGSQSGTDRLAPRVIVRPRRARVSRTGAATLHVSCPSGELSCRVRLRLRLGSVDVATRTLSLAGGTTRSFRLRLSRGARLRLARKGSLLVTAVTTSRDAAGNQVTARMAVRLLAPRRR